MLIGTGLPYIRQSPFRHPHQYHRRTLGGALPRSAAVRNRAKLSPSGSSPPDNSNISHRVNRWLNFFVRSFVFLFVFIGLYFLLVSFVSGSMLLMPNGICDWFWVYSQCYCIRRDNIGSVGIGNTDNCIACCDRWAHRQQILT